MKGVKVMKIYRYHPETCCYLGEDFADESATRRGVFVVPDDATTIAPPAEVHARLLYFDVAANQWGIREAPVDRAAESSSIHYKGTNWKG